VSSGQNIQAFSLLNFTESMLLPLTQQRIVSYQLTSMASEMDVLRHCMLEAFLWLDLGVCWNVFDRLDAHHVFVHYFYPMFHDTAVCFGPKSLFFPDFQRLLEKAMRTKKFGERTFGHSVDRQVISIFQDCVESTAEFLERVLVQRLIASLGLEGEREWQLRLRSTAEPSDIQLAITNQKLDGLSANSELITGLLLSLEHMVELERLHIIFGNHAVLRNIYQIRAWSLNFHNATVEQRFLQLLDQCDEMLIQEASVQMPAVTVRYAKGGIKQAGVKLVQDWKNRGSLYIVAAV